MYKAILCPGHSMVHQGDQLSMIVKFGIAGAKGPGYRNILIVGIRK